jgi:hypothetical protein
VTKRLKQHDKREWNASHCFCQQRWKPYQGAHTVCG